MHKNIIFIVEKTLKNFIPGQFTTKKYLQGQKTTKTLYRDLNQERLRTTGLIDRNKRPNHP